MYVARIIMGDGVGKVAYAQNVAAYFIAIATLGFPAYGIREIAKSRNNYKICSQVFIELFFINALMTLVASILYTITIFYVYNFRTNILLYMCVGISVWINFANIDWLYQGKEEYGYITIRNLIVKFISLIVLFVFVREKNDYLIYALIGSLGLVCNYLFNLFHARHYICLNFSIKDLNIKQHLRPLFILGMTAFLGTIYNQLDVTMLGVMTDDSTVGYYSNAHKIIIISLSSCIAVTTVFMPRLSYYYHNDKIALNRLVNLGVKIIFFIVVPAAFGLALISNDLVILLFGESFKSAGTTLAVFTPMLLIRPIGDLLCYQLLISAGMESKRIYTSLLATIINVLLNVLLIPIWKQNGAAIASIVAEITINGLLFKEVSKISTINIDCRYYLKVIFATMMLCASVVFINNFIDSNFYRVVSDICVGGIVYIFIGYLLKNEVIILIKDKILNVIRR